LEKRTESFPERQGRSISAPPSSRRSPGQIRMCVKRSNLTLKLAEAMKDLTASDWENPRRGPQEIPSGRQREAFVKWINILEEIRLHSATCKRCR
jgi:hypothetical protein